MCKVCYNCIIIANTVKTGGTLMSIIPGGISMVYLAIIAGVLLLAAAVVIIVIGVSKNK